MPLSENWITEAHDAWVLGELSTFLHKLGVTDWTIRREQSLSGYVTILQMKVSIFPNLSVHRVNSDVTRNVKVVFRLPHMETRESVNVAVSLAVSDLPLQVTSDFDYRLDEYVTAQRKLNDILKSHKPVNCPGLQQKWECSICQDEYGDPKYGMRLSALLKRIEQEELRDRKVAELDVIKYMELKTGRRTTIEEESEQL